MNNQLPQRQSETAFSQPSEIDLFELIGLLWKKKLTIIFITIVCMVLAGGYAFFVAKEKWTAKAYISPPGIAQLQSYIDARREYGRVLNENVDTENISKELFNDFINYAYSPDVKLNFLEGTDYYKDKVKELKNLSAKKLFLEQLSDRDLSIMSPGQQKGLRYYTILMTVDNPMSAKEIVEQYIQYLNKKAFARVNYEFNDRISALILSLKKEKSDIEEKTEMDRKNSIGSLTNSLEMAKQGGIKDYYDIKMSNQILTNANRFMLGEKLLSAELDIMKNSPIVYPYRYYQIIEELKSLTKLEGVDWFHNQAYKYQLRPEEPLIKDAPKRLFIVIIGLIIGIVISLIYIFLQEYHSSQKI